jgi:ubiquinone/menaquinone biosynthesis C-methylase UbiE
MFLKSANVYDLIYGLKDYRDEAEKVRRLVATNSRTGGRDLLDVACGTGIHARFLAEHFEVTGIDLDPGMIEVAKERAPEIAFQVADMREFDLGRQFDAVTCLFSSIGYAVTVEALNASIANFARHTKPGGVVIVEPWFLPGQLSDKYVTARHVNVNPQLQVVRMSRTSIDGTLSTLHFHYMVGTLDGIEYFSEEHYLTMYTHQQYLDAFEAAGLDVEHDNLGISGRGVYVGRKGPQERR